VSAYRYLIEPIVAERFGGDAAREMLDAFEAGVLATTGHDRRQIEHFLDFCRRNDICLVAVGPRAPYFRPADEALDAHVVPEVRVADVVVQPESAWPKPWHLVSGPSLLDAYAVHGGFGRA
jgi:hypothetical protein